MTGTVIFLIGTSSSGKTSIARALQDALEPRCLEMGVDRFINMLPARYLRPPLWDDVLGKANWPGATGRTHIAPMHHAIAAAARLGNNILTDHVCIEGHRLRLAPSSIWSIAMRDTIWRWTHPCLHQANVHSR